MSETTAPAKAGTKKDPPLEGQTAENAVVPSHGTGNQIAKASDSAPVFPLINLDTAEDLPDLTDAQPLPLEFASEYWEPGAEGEVKRVVFSHIEDSLMKDRANPDEQVSVPTAFFYEKRKDSIVLIRQASKLLVSALQNNAVQRGTPLQIVFTGKKKFKNGNIGDSWSVKPLLLKES